MHLALVMQLTISLAIALSLSYAFYFEPGQSCGESSAFFYLGEEPKLPRAIPIFFHWSSCKNSWIKRICSGYFLFFDYWAMLLEVFALVRALYLGVGLGCHNEKF